MSRAVLKYGRSRGQRVCTLLLLLTFAFVIGALGQVTTGSVQGVVRDPNGAVVSGATVHVTNVDTGVTTDATTNNEGFFSVPNLQPGRNYRVTVNASGFGE